MKRPSAKLVKRWYDRLRREGFNDLEMRPGADGGAWYEAPSTYSHHEKTLDGSVGPADTDGRLTHRHTYGTSARDMALLENMRTFGKPTAVWDTPVAEHHRARAAKVADRPRRCRADDFIADLVERGNLLGAARDNGLTKEQGRGIKRKVFTQ